MRGKQSGGEPRLGQGFSEPVARPGKVVPHRRRVEARVDPAEQDREPARNDVRHSPVGRGGDLFSGRSIRSGHASYSPLVNLLIPVQKWGESGPIRNS